MNAKTCFRVAFFLILALASTECVLPTSASAQTKKSSEVVPSATSAASSDTAEAAAIKTDLQQMRVILNQMATNLASVSDSQSPLKHQFQLDIEMWQVLMMQMQRRVDRLEGSSSSPKPDR